MVLPFFQDVQRLEILNRRFHERCSKQSAKFIEHSSNSSMFDWAISIFGDSLIRFVYV